MRCRSTSTCFSIAESSCRTSENECRIAAAATEPAGFLEIGLGVSTNRTALRRGAFLDFFGRADSEEQVGQGKTGWVLHPFLFRAGFAKVHLLHLPFQNLRQEN